MLFKTFFLFSIFISYALVDAYESSQDASYAHSMGAFDYDYNPPEPKKEPPAKVEKPKVEKPKMEEHKPQPQPSQAERNHHNKPVKKTAGQSVIPKSHHQLKKRYIIPTLMVAIPVAVAYKITKSVASPFRSIHKHVTK